MEYTLLTKFCALWLVLTFILGKITLAFKIGKTFGEVKGALWRYQTGYTLLRFTVAVALLAGTGFFYHIHWPQIVWFILVIPGVLMTLAILPMIRSGKVDDKIITYEGHDFFADAVTLILYYFGHAYGPLGLNPWPM